MELLKKYFEDAGIETNDAALEKLQKYMEEILEYNKSINLTAITEPEEFIVKHYIDSAAVTLLPEFQRAKKVCDMGTGGGFPGIPLAILAPEKEFILADSLNKRLKVINNICEEIGISNVETFHSRAEDMGRKAEYRENFELCVSRAVANLSVLAEYCLPLVKNGGYFIAYKTKESEEEINSAKRAVKILGGKIEKVATAEVPGAEHVLVVIKKIVATPKTYPRKAGIPSKQPL